MSRRTSFRDQFHLHRIPVVALLFGGTLVLLSGYQLSPYKYRCLKYCRTPLGWGDRLAKGVGVAAGVGGGTLILIAVL